MAQTDAGIVTQVLTHSLTFPVSLIILMTVHPVVVLKPSQLIEMELYSKSCSLVGTITASKTEIQRMDYINSKYSDDMIFARYSHPSHKKMSYNNTVELINFCLEIKRAML